MHSDLKGNCTIRIGDGLTDDNDEFEILYPTDGSANVSTGGKFPCGRSTNNVEAKEIKLPANLTCSSCTL